MPLPSLSHLQFQIIGILRGGEQSGQYVRDELAQQGVKKSGSEEEHGESDSSCVEFLFNAATGAVDVSVSAERKTYAAAACLKKDGDRKKNSENELEDVENHITRYCSKMACFRKGCSAKNI